MSNPLRESRTGLVGADGICEVSFGPAQPFARWEITMVAVSSTSAQQTTCKVYFGSVDPGHFIGGTFTGNTDVDEFTSAQVLVSGLFLTVRWEGGTPGSQCTARFEGTADDMSGDKAGAVY